MFRAVRKIDEIKAILISKDTSSTVADSSKRHGVQTQSKRKVFVYFAY